MATMATSAWGALPCNKTWFLSFSMRVLLRRKHTFFVPHFPCPSSCRCYCCYITYFLLQLLPLALLPFPAGRLAATWGGKASVARQAKEREILQAWLHGTRRYRLAACSDPPSDGTSRQPRDESHAIRRGRTLSRDHLAVAVILTLLGYYNGPPTCLRCLCHNGRGRKPPCLSYPVSS